MTTIDVLQQILVHQMQLDSSRVFEYNSSVDLPQDEHLFIVLFYTSRTPYSNNSKIKVDANGNIEEHQSMNVCEDITISLLSQNYEASDRAYEVLMALRSVYSQGLQENNRLHIATIGDVTDSSFVEASSRLNRFDVRIKVHTTYDKINTVDYYDKFPVSSTFEPEIQIEE